MRRQGRWRPAIEIIRSQRKAKKARLMPTERTRKAPVKFLRDNGRCFSLLEDFNRLDLKFSIHWTGIGRNHRSQWLTNPLSCSSKKLLWNRNSNTKHVINQEAFNRWKCHTFCWWGWCRDCVLVKPLRPVGSKSCPLPVENCISQFFRSLA